MTTNNTEAKTAAFLPKWTNMEGREVLAICGDQKRYRAEVGDAATVVIGSDRCSVTVVAVSKSGKKVTVQFDNSIAQPGSDYYGAQTYDHTRNEDGRTMEFSLRASGYYKVVGHPSQSSYGLVIGQRRTYSDPSF